MKLHKDYELALFCDLHGHSKNYNAFMYGCRSLCLPEDTKIFPFILSKLNPYFSFEESKFGGYKFKETTARVCMFRELVNVPAVYTLEASFLGSKNGIVYNPEILKSIGKDLCRSLIPYCNIEIPLNLPLETSLNRNKNLSLSNNLKKVSSVKWFNELVEELKTNKKLLNSGDLDDNDCSGSDSAPSEDDLPNRIIDKIIPKEIKREFMSPKRSKLQIMKLLNKKKNPSLSLKKEESEDQKNFINSRDEDKQMVDRKSVV